MNNNAIHYRKRLSPAHYRAARNSGKLRARFCALALLLVFSICTQEFVAPLRAFAAERDGGVSDSGSKDSGTFFDQFFTDITMNVAGTDYKLLENDKIRNPDISEAELGSNISVMYKFTISQKSIDPSYRNDAKAKAILEALESGEDVDESDFVTKDEPYPFTMPELFRDAVEAAGETIELIDKKGNPLGEVSVDSGEETAYITFFEQAFEEQSSLSGWFLVQGKLTADGEGGDNPDKIILKFAEGVQVEIPLKTTEATYDIKKSWLKSYIDVPKDEENTQPRADKGPLASEWQAEITVHEGAGNVPCIPQGFRLVDQYVGMPSKLDLKEKMAPVEKADVKVEKGTSAKKEEVPAESYELLESTEDGFTLRFTKQVDLNAEDKVWVTYKTKTAKVFQDVINELVQETKKNTQNQQVGLKNSVTLWPADKKGETSEAEADLYSVNMLEKLAASPAPTPKKNCYDYSVYVNWSTYNFSGLSGGSYFGIPLDSENKLDIKEVLPNGTKLQGFVLQNGTTVQKVYIERAARNNNFGKNAYNLMKTERSANSRYEVTVVEGTDAQHPILRIQPLDAEEDYIDQIIPLHIRIEATDPNNEALKNGVNNKVQLTLDNTTYESEKKLGNTGTPTLTKAGTFEWKTMQITWTITAENWSGEGLTLDDTLGKGNNAAVKDIQNYIQGSMEITRNGSPVSSESFEVNVEQGVQGRPDWKTIHITPKDGLDFGDGQKYIVKFKTQIDPKDLGSTGFQANNFDTLQLNTADLMRNGKLEKTVYASVGIRSTPMTKGGGFVSGSQTATQWNIDINHGFLEQTNLRLYDQMQFTQKPNSPVAKDWSSIFRPTGVKIWYCGPEDWKEGGNAASPADLLKGKEPVYTETISAEEWQQMMSEMQSGNVAAPPQSDKVIYLLNLITSWQSNIPNVPMLVCDFRNLPSDVLKQITKDGDMKTFNKFIRVQYEFACIENNGEAKLAQYLAQSGIKTLRNRAVIKSDKWETGYNTGDVTFGTYEKPLTKEGAITSGTSGITWTVNLNKNNGQTVQLPESVSKIDMTFRDTFGSPNLMLDETSIKINKVAADGKTDGVNHFTPDMLTTEYTENNCLSFMLDLSKIAAGDRDEAGNWNEWYRIEYKTVYYSDGTTTGSVSVENNASWSIVESGSMGGQVSAKVSDVKVQGGISLDQVGAIKVIKTDKNTGRFLKDAMFGLYEVDANGGKGKLVKSAYTNANGIATFTGLGYNSKYWLEETMAPPYYEKVADVMVTVDRSMKEGQVEVKVEDIRKAEAGLTVTKVEDGTNTVLQGAVFALQLTDSSEKDRFFRTDGTEVTSIKDAEAETNAAGKLVYKNLPHGTYSLIEVSAPKGYTTAKPTEGIVLNGENVSVTVEDTKIVPKTGGFHFTKVDAKGNLLAGAEFTLSRPEGGSVVARESSDSGQVVFKSILPGTYELTETKAPDGYEKLEGKISVIIKEDNNDGEIAPNSKLPDGYSVKDGALTVTNVPQLTSLRIWKTSDTGEAVPLAGAEFALKGSGDNAEISLKAVSGASGELEFSNLPFGKYTLTELTAPSGYLPIAASMAVTISKDGIAVTGVDAEKVAVITRDSLQWLQVKNTAKQQLASLRIWKTNDAANAHALKGAEFALTGLEENKEISLKASSDGSGELVFSDLPLGKYTLTEVTAPSGYQPITATMTVTISKDGIAVAGVDAERAVVVTRDSLQWLQVKNTAELQFAPLRIWKTSDAENALPLKGAEFLLTGLEENKAVSIKASSDAAGEVVFSKIPLGNYTLTELTAPSGYQPIAAPITVTVSKDGIAVAGVDSGTAAVVTRDSLQWLQVKNTEEQQLAALRIWKTNGTENVVPLAGAEFDLTGLEENKEIALKAVSNASGELVFSKLPLGSYTLTERVAPSGYQLLESPMTVTLTKDGIVVTGVGSEKIAVVERDAMQWLQVKNTAEKPQPVSLRIWKTNNAQSASPLEGAEFLLTGLEGNPPTSIKATSNASGELVFPNLSVGSYILQEVVAPSGYRLLASPVTVTVTKENIALTGVDANMVTVITRNGELWLQVKNNRKSSGGGGGSSDRPSNGDNDNNSTPPSDTVVIPIGPTEPELSDIPDNEVPLGEAPILVDEDPALPPDPIEISDEDVPLAGLPFAPKTGDSAARPIGLAALSALSLALIKALRKKQS